MAITLMECRIYVRKGVIFTIRGCYRLIRNHPLLLLMVYALVYTCKSYPYVFSLLLSASPVLVCTAALLGTLLLYGQQNTPETETEKKTRYESISLKNGMSNDEQNESNKDETSLVVNKLAPIRVDGGIGLSKERRRSDGRESESDETCKELDEVVEKHKLEHGEDMVDHYAIISKVMCELLESESDHEEKSGDSKSEDADSSDLDSPPHATDDSDSDLGSDPNASTDDTIPMLDELHPLLAVQMSRDASESALTEQSPRSSSSSMDSGEETEVQETESEADSSKKDQIKSVITWTEEDQRNLMDVGSSEIERNQRLERILRRRRNMSMSMVPEINLIDLENPDLQFNVPPISTKRNPFDLPQDSAPGSAPSVMSQTRRNPFDLPYYEEDEDESQEELRPSQLRQPFLRRRDHFLARPSIFAPNRQRLKPLFVPSEEEKGVEGDVHHGDDVEEEEQLKSGPESVVVYDTSRSPSAVGKNYSTSSSFSDLQAHCNDHGSLNPPRDENQGDFEGESMSMGAEKH